MILSDSAVATIRSFGPTPFHLDERDDRVPVVAYVRLTDGRVYCPAHRFYCNDVSENDRAGGQTIEPQDADNSAMDNAQCDAVGCDAPIAAVMLAAQCAQFVAHCHACRLAYENRETVPARPCNAHMTYAGLILAAIVDGSPAPIPPWQMAAETTERANNLLTQHA